MFNLIVNIKNEYDTNKSYSILVAEGLLLTPENWKINFNKYSQIVIITDSVVKSIYLDSLIAALKLIISKPAVTLIIESGEQSKTSVTKEWLELEMLRQNLGRDTLCIALGGGVVGDLVGFMAATYMRGIDYIQLPTTMLAMVDSSIGGKTAINTIYGKNLIGAFWQPRAVIVDLNCLVGLPKIHLVSGLVEAIKIFLLSAKDMFLYVEQSSAKILAYDKLVLRYIITEAIKLKTMVVAADEREANLRVLLNLGHTVAHGVEVFTNYKLLHGYAVAYGIIIEAKIAVILGVLNINIVWQIVNLFEKLGIIHALNEAMDCNIMEGLSNKNGIVDKILSGISYDKKNKNGEIYCVLLTQIGGIQINKSDYVAENSIVAHNIIKNNVTQVPLSLIRQALCARIDNNKHIGNK